MKPPDCMTHRIETVCEWYIMVYHGISWYIMVYHGISWYIMVYHGISWYIMVYHVQWYIISDRCDVEARNARGDCNNVTSSKRKMKAKGSEVSECSNTKINFIQSYTSYQECIATKKQLLAHNTLQRVPCV